MTFTSTSMPASSAAKSVGMFGMLLPAILLLGGTPASAQVPSLGSAAAFGVLGATAVTSTGPSVVTGHVGVAPGLAITGFPPATQTGLIHAGNAVAAQAHSDAHLLYTALVGATCTTSLTGQNLGGLTLTPGVYCFSSSAQLTGTLILDALNQANAVFIFKIGSSLTTASGSTVSMINSASACNVFWQVGSSATLGTTTTFAGHIVALASITMNTGVNMSGNALALTGAITLDTVLAGNICCRDTASVAQFGTGCTSGGAIMPSLTGTPGQVGGFGTVQIFSPSTPATLAVLLAGFDATFSASLNVALPLSLSSLGYPGCFLYAAGDAAILPVQLGGNGQATFTLQIPDRFKLCGFDVTFQAVILSTNGVLLTNGLTSTLGS